MIYVIALSGGKDSQCCLEYVLEHRHELDPKPTEILAEFADTGNEHEATLEHVDYIGRKTGVTVVRLRNELDLFGLAKKKGRFPSFTAKYCTTELKVKPCQRWVKTLNDDCIVVLGIRHDESASRSDATEWEHSPAYGAELWRPILTWTAQQVFDYLKSRNSKPNPLYAMGHERVGCMPCVNCSQNEIKLIAELHPQHIDKVRRWEREVGATFFAPKKPGQINWIDDVVKWAHVNQGELGHMPLRCDKYKLCE